MVQLFYQRKVNDHPTYFECLEILDQNWNTIERLPNFYFADVGHKIINGELTNEYAIRIFIKGNKLTDEVSFMEFLPKTISEVNTDLIATFHFEHSCSISPEISRINTVDPLKGGISIGPFNDIGTLGLVMMSNVYGLCAIGTFHGKHIGSDLFQPSPQEKKAKSYKKIGTIIDHYHDRDISIMTIESNINVSGSIVGIPDPRKVLTWTEIEQIHFEKEVIYKSGRSTGITEGIISGLSPRNKSFTVSPLNVSDVVSCKGDSGSFYVRNNGDVLGILREGSIGDTKYARASGLDDIMEFWGLSFLDEPNFV